MLNVLLSLLLSVTPLQEKPVNDSTLNVNNTSYRINWLQQEIVNNADEQVIINLAPFTGNETFLKIQSDKHFYLFNNTSLVAAAKSTEINLLVDSLRGHLSSDTLILFHQSAPALLKYGFYSKNKVTNLPSFTQELGIIENTFGDGRTNFVIALIMVFLILLSTLKVSFSKKFQDVFSLSGTFSTRPVEGDNVRVRLFEQDGLFAALTYTFGTAIIIYLYLGFTSADYLEQNSANYISFFQSWLYIIILLIVKISVIFFLSGLYKTSRINTFYIKELINISTLFITILLTVTILLFFYKGGLPEYWGGLARYSIVGMYLIRMGLLYFKILKLSGFTYLYLFSYFCATEVFPFILGLKYFY